MPVEKQLQIGCVIMASGISKRFGSNKLLAKYEGKTFLDRILNTTEKLFDRRIVVTRSEEAAQRCKQRGAEVILHTLPYRSDTVRLGVEAMRDMDAIVFCPCDQPALTRESLQTMLCAPSIQDETILRMAWETQFGTPILFGKKYFDALCSLPQNKGGGYLAAQFPDEVQPVCVQSPWELFDVDTPEDLEKLKTAPVS